MRVSGATMVTASSVRVRPGRRVSMCRSRRVPVQVTGMGVTQMAVGRSPGKAEEGEDSSCHGAAHQAGDVHRVHCALSRSRRFSYLAGLSFAQT
jgi:hypothetical protein